MFKLSDDLATSICFGSFKNILIFVSYQLICHHIKCWIYYISKKSETNLVMLTWVLFVLEIQFPIGIDSHRFIRALETPQVQDRINELKRTFTGRKVSSCFCMITFYFNVFYSVLFISHT